MKYSNAARTKASTVMSKPPCIKLLQVHIFNMSVDCVLTSRNDISMWTDNTMGNCFTFNGEKGATPYKARKAGQSYGIYSIFPY